MYAFLTKLRQDLVIQSITFAMQPKVLDVLRSKVYNKYQGPKIIAPFHLLLVLMSLDDFKI